LWLLTLTSVLKVPAAAFAAEVAAAEAEFAALVALVAAWDAEVAEAEALFELLVA
jgi:hypothetical protein